MFKLKYILLSTIKHVQGDFLRAYYDHFSFTKRFAFLVLEEPLFMT